MKRITHYFCLRAEHCGYDTGRVLNHTTSRKSHRIAMLAYGCDAEFRQGGIGRLVKECRDEMRRYAGDCARQHDYRVAKAIVEYLS